MNPQYVAAAVSCVGLLGIYRKRSWGPLICGVASTGWAIIAGLKGPENYPWAFVESMWAVSGYATAAKWYIEERVFT